MANVVVEADLTILRQEFSAAYEKTQRTEGDKKIDVTEFLFSPKAGSTPGEMSIKDIAGEFNKLIKDFTGKDGEFTPAQFEDKLKELDKSGSATWYENIKIKVNQAFVYKKSEAYQEPQPQNDDPALKNEFSYAFQLTIDTSGVLPDFEVFNIEGLSFAVWDCNYPKVLEKLSIFKIEDYIQ